MATSGVFMVPTPGLRDDTRQRVTAEWDRLGMPGTWWDGRERLAIAQEARRARDCDLCAARREALTPAMVVGQHAAAAELSAEVVDAIHRIATDSSRLTRSWLDRLLGSGVSAVQYVEMVGVVMTHTLVDTLARALGSEAPALPQTHPGEPSREPGPAAVQTSSAWVPLVPPERWQGTVGRELATRGAAGAVPSAGWCLSAVTEEQESAFRLKAVTYDHPHGELTDAEAEFVAVTVSTANDCFY